MDNTGGSATSAVTNSTFTSNSAGSGGGIFNIFGAVTITNTIVFGNSGSAARQDCFNGINSGGHNLVGIGTGSPTGGTGDVTTADAKLGTLQDNGGTTLTHALQTGSPAIDAGDDGAAPATDQVGTTRPVGAVSDIGAIRGNDWKHPGAGSGAVSVGTNRDGHRTGVSVCVESGPTPGTQLRLVIDDSADCVSAWAEADQVYRLSQGGFLQELVHA